MLGFEHVRTGAFDLPSGHRDLSESAAATAACDPAEETNRTAAPDALESFDVAVKRRPLGRYDLSTTDLVAARETTGELAAQPDADVVEWITPSVARGRRADRRCRPRDR